MMTRLPVAELVSLQRNAPGQPYPAFLVQFLGIPNFFWSEVPCVPTAERRHDGVFRELPFPYLRLLSRRSQPLRLRPHPSTVPQENAKRVSSPSAISTPTPDGSSRLSRVTMMHSPSFPRSVSTCSGFIRSSFTFYSFAFSSSTSSFTAEATFRRFLPPPAASVFGLGITGSAGRFTDA